MIAIYIVMAIFTMIGAAVSLDANDIGPGRGIPAALLLGLAWPVFLLVVGIHTIIEFARKAW